MTDAQHQEPLDLDNAPLGLRTLLIRGTPLVLRRHAGLVNALTLRVRSTSLVLCRDAGLVGVLTLGHGRQQPLAEPLDETRGDHLSLGHDDLFRDLRQRTAAFPEVTL